jgi:hypothetical protein
MREAVPYCQYNSICSAGVRNRQAPNAYTNETIFAMLMKLSADNDNSVGSHAKQFIIADNLEFFERDLLVTGHDTGQNN